MKKTQEERGQNLVSNAHKMVTFRTPSFLRLFATLTASTLLGIYELSLDKDWFSWSIVVVFMALAFMGVIETSRYGCLIASRMTRISSTAFLLASFVVTFLINRLFEYLEWLPLHRTSMWSFIVFFGLLIGVAMSPSKKG